MNSRMRGHIKGILYLIVLTIVVSTAIVGCEAPLKGGQQSEDLLPGSSRLSDVLSDGGLEGYARAVEPRDFRFPEDHGPHRDFRNEWWYVTGNLDGAGGERFGFELTFFRFSLSSQARSTIDSAWQTNQVYIAHFAITDVSANQFHVAQRYSRGSAGLAGATADPFRLWLDDWSIDADVTSGPWRLRAHGDDFGIELDLLRLKPAILNGDDGLSQKSDEPGNASYYYSIPRMQSTGTLNVGDRTYSVSGLSWLDREWSSSALSNDQRGWDWFALQLSDGSELMFYQGRRTAGAFDIHSAGTWIDANGKATRLLHDDVSISVTGYWQSKRGDRYPAAWEVNIPSLDLSLVVSPAIADQELVTNVRYWEGAVDVSGHASGASISGRGYVELTGYVKNQKAVRTRGQSSGQ